jgi:hypothetical protein
MKRTFSLLLNGVQAGSFKSQFPNESARKIFRKTCMQLNNVQEFEFEIIDIHTLQIYKYEGKRFPVNNSMSFEVDGITRTFQQNFIHKVRRIRNKL